MAQAALLTVGYGDFSPQSEAGRAFFVLWAMLAVPTTTALVASTVDALMEHMGYKKMKKIEQNAGKRFLRQLDSYKRNSRDNKDRDRNENSPRLPPNHGSYDKTHIAAMLLKDVIYDHLSDTKYTYDFDSWEWFLYALGAIEDPPHEEPKDIHEIHEEWNPQRPWDWLGDDTAIASKDPEIKWILQKLVNKLVRELLGIRKERAPGLGDGLGR
jgi:potassium channel subfamily K